MPAYRKPTELLALSGAFEKNPQRRRPVGPKSDKSIGDPPPCLGPDEAACSAEGEAKGLRLALEEARRPFWRRWLGVAALCALPAVASAQVDPDSATGMMPACRAAVRGETRVLTSDEAYLAGTCHGMLRALLTVDVVTCAPNGSTQGQATRVVVQYIGAHPARQHENFLILAVEALRAAWPCR